MSTVLSAPASSSNAMPGRAKSPSFTKCRPRAYSPWRNPVSERQIDAHFEHRILPELSVMLEGTFEDLSELDREEAVQDSVCQALEAFRTLRLHQNIRQNTARDETALVLAKFASSQYLAGVRFAAPRSESCL
jgi:hypothetical protein